MAAAVAIPGASGVVVSTNTSRYLGFAVTETAGAAAQIRIREGSASGLILDTIKLASGESATAWYGPNGIMCNGSLYYEKVTGTVEGSVRFG